MHGPRAAAAGTFGAVVDVMRSAFLSSRLVRRLPHAREQHRLLEEAPALIWVVGIGPDRVEALQRELGRDLGVVGDERRVAGLDDGQLELELLGIMEEEAPVGTLGGDAGRRQPLLPELEGVGGADSPDDALDHAGARIAPRRAGVLEEGQVGSVRADFVSVEQVVDRRIVLVDRFLDQAEAEQSGVELDVLRGVRRDRGDVVNPLEPHTGTLSAPRPAQLADLSRFSSSTWYSPGTLRSSHLRASSWYSAQGA